MEGSLRTRVMCREEVGVESSYLRDAGYMWQDRSSEGQVTLCGGNGRRSRWSFLAHVLCFVYLSI